MPRVDCKKHKYGERRYNREGEELWVLRTCERCRKIEVTLYHRVETKVVGPVADTSSIESGE